MISGKNEILKTISRYGTPFRIGMVVADTGLSKQLVYKHLIKMLEDGWVKKISNGTYEVADLAQIVEDLADDVPVRLSVRQPKPKGAIDSNTAKIFATTVANILAAKRLKFPEIDEFNSAFNQYIDDTILYFRELKRYMNAGNVSERTARKIVDPAQLEEIWNTGIRYHSPECKLGDWLALIKEAEEEEAGEAKQPSKEDECQNIRKLILNLKAVRCAENASTIDEQIEEKEQKLKELGC